MVEANEKYQGTGKVVSALGRATVEGFVSELVGLAAGYGLAAVTKNPNRHAFAFVTGNALGAIGTLHGAYKGWQSAKHGQEQFEAAQAENSRWRTMIDAQRQGLNAEGPAR